VQWFRDPAPPQPILGQKAKFLPFFGTFRASIYFHGWILVHGPSLAMTLHFFFEAFFNIGLEVFQNLGSRDPSGTPLPTDPNPMRMYI